MLVAPLRFKSVLLEEMDRVIAAAHMGRPASMILKNNSISDRDIILKLQEASCAGVRIDMIVRGICCVRAGVPGKTENLHIRSLVGRYLEHGRIYSFFDGAHTRRRFPHPQHRVPRGGGRARGGSRAGAEAYRHSAAAAAG